MKSILRLASVVCALALNGAVAQAATVKLPHNMVFVPPMNQTGSNAIVGTWLTSYDGGVHSTFTQWHRDGTTSQIVDFAPKTGNVQLGNWKTNVDGTLSLYLIGWTFDLKGNNVTGYFTKTETDTVSRRAYSGNFEVTFYDLTGNILFQHQGTLTATPVSH